MTDFSIPTTPVSAPPGFDPATARNSAKLANSQFKNAEALEGWQREINKYGGNVGNDVKAYNEKWYGKNNTPQDDALMRIYQTQQQSGAVPRWATSIVHEGIGAGSASPAATPLGLPHGLGAGLGASLTYGVGKPMAAGGRSARASNTQQAFDQAYPAITGRALTPVDTASLPGRVAAARDQRGISR